MAKRRFFLYIDGGSRGNPGPAGIGIVIFDAGRKKVKEVYKYIGEATNNIAEYHALVQGLEEALHLKATDIVVHVDSELVARQLSGEYRVKDAAIRVLFEKAVETIKLFDSFDVKHIGRSDNKEADRLANKAMNLAGLFG